VKHRFLVSFLLFLAISSGRVAAQNRVIVRDSLGLHGLQFTCLLVSCNIVEGVDGTLGQVFVVAPGPLSSVTTLLQELLGQLGVVDVEPDLVLHLTQQQTWTAPPGLWDSTPVYYYGTTAWDGYINQPAVQIINLRKVQSRNSFGASGCGIVAVVDTGVDPTHPVLQRVLVNGYDFTRNQWGGSERTDVNQSMSGQSGGDPGWVNQSTMAVVNQSGETTFSQPRYAAFGHGTMVSGIVHLVAPNAHIMPLKAFHADGTGYLSDVLRALYFATQNHANVINMSFDFQTLSTELSKATHYANTHGVVLVASVGNDGRDVVVYPAELSNVMGIASTSNNDTLSSFSNYGHPPVWVGAPGEGIISIYPYGTYAAGWGTSFSAPLVSGTAALLRCIDTDLNQNSAAQAIAHAKYISPQLGYGRLDVYQAAAAWCRASDNCPTH
jgi:subtilisin family serine protease